MKNKEDVIMTIGQRIAIARIIKQLSRKELGEKCGLVNPAIRIAAYETDQKIPKKDLLDKIANTLGISVIWLRYGVFDLETMYYVLQNNDIDICDEFDFSVFKNSKEFCKFITHNEDVQKFTATDWKMLSIIIMYMIKQDRNIE